MMRTEQTVRKAVKRANPHTALTGADQVLNTVTHFCRALLVKVTAIME